MAAKLTPWEGPPPAEPALREAFRAEGLSPYAWSNGPADRYAAHTHGYDKVLYCAEGSITFLVEGTRIEMQVGDRLDLPAGTSHGALVGPHGCTCLEAHR